MTTVMSKIRFIRDAEGWYRTDTDFLRYVIKRAGKQTWFIYEAPLGKNFGTHIATASRVSDAKSWLTQRIKKESLMQ